MIPNIQASVTYSLPSFLEEQALDVHSIFVERLADSCRQSNYSGEQQRTITSDFSAWLESTDHGFPPCVQFFFDFLNIFLKNGQVIGLLLYYPSVIFRIKIALFKF